jgi:HPt (histidine-containing phosphotransfer) domain-containing protein
VLNKLVRDKQPPEVIEAARQQAKAKKDQSSENTPQPTMDPRFAEIFVRDARKSIAVLDAIYEKRGSYSDEDMRTYGIHVHGMKSALANIGRMDLSAIALTLEMSVRAGDTEIMLSQTSAFLDSLRALVEELTPEETAEGGETADEDRSHLHEKLLAVKAACEEYDEKTADELITKLREKTWSQPAKELLSAIAEHLLHSDFDEIVELVNTFMETK